MPRWLQAYEPGFTGGPLLVDAIATTITIRMDDGTHHADQTYDLVLNEQDFDRFTQYLDELSERSTP